MESKDSRIQVMASDPVGRALMKLSAPAIAGMVVMAVYNVVDTFFVSLLRDTTAIAATGVVFPLFQLVGSIGLTFGIGAASVISRRLGEKNVRAANRVASTAFYSALGVGVVFSVVGVIFIKPLLVLFGATETILDTASLYGGIIVGGSIFQTGNMALNNILRSEGATVRSSTGQILGAVLNMALDPLLIFTFNMGIAGAAVATIISQAIGSLYLLSYYLRDKGAVEPHLIKHFCFRLQTYREIMALGIPTLVRQFLGSISFAILNNAAGRYGGDDAIAALSVTLRLFSLLIMSLIGLAQGLQPLAGYNYGAKNFARVKKSFKIAFNSATVFCFVLGIVGFFFARDIMRIFTPQDKEVIDMGVLSLKLMSVVLIPVGFAVVFGGVFQGLGDGRSALILAAGQQGIFLIPLVVVLPKFMELTGVFAALPAAFFLTSLVGAALFYKVILRLRKEERSFL